MNIRPDQIQKIIEIHKRKYGLILSEKGAREYLETISKIFEWLLKNSHQNNYPETEKNV